MTQSIDRPHLNPVRPPTLTVQLLPMQVLDPPPIQTSNISNLVSWGALPNHPELSSELYLGLCPGEPAEMLVRLTYVGAEPINYQIQLMGDLPDQVQIDLRTEGQSIDRHHPVEAVIRFFPAADFFENYQPIQNTPGIQQNYAANLRIYQQNDAGQISTLLATAAFQLHIRPRSLYPAFLPAVYREVDFIGRFLKIFEQSFEPAVQTLQTLWAYLDPHTAPQALLPFLAQWVGWHNEPNWTVEQQRQLIRRAMEIYRWRGTKRGLQLYLHLYTGLPIHAPDRPPHAQPIQIHEVFRRGFVIGNTEMGNTSLLGGGKPFHFIVRLCPDREDAIDRALVESIIEQEKPAFCTYDLYIDVYSQVPMAEDEIGGY
jgi:phage tail-like protein